MTANFDKLLPVERMLGEDQQETHALREMFERSRAYLLSHPWCELATKPHFGFGVGGVVAVFLYRVKIKTGGEEWLWVVEGDLPSAYLVADRAETPAAALSVYADLMDEWVRAVRSGEGLESVFPVEAPADVEHADALESRTRTLRQDIIPSAEHGARS